METFANMRLMINTEASYNGDFKHSSVTVEQEE
jgi:hypothetical protein